MIIYSLDVLRFLFGTSLLFHVQFLLLLSDLNIGFSRGRSGGLVFPSQNFPQFIVIHTVKSFGIVNKTEIDVFHELSCFIHDPANVVNLIACSSAFSKTSLNIFTILIFFNFNVVSFRILSLHWIYHNIASVLFWFSPLQCLCNLSSWPGIKPTPPTLEGTILTTGPPGKSPDVDNLKFSSYFFLILFFKLYYIVQC